MGPPSSPSSPGGPAPAGGDREAGSGRRGWWATGSEGARGDAGETPWVMATGAVKCRQPCPQSQVSLCPGALSCMGGRSDAPWVETHSQPHSLHVTSHPSPTATIPCPPPPTFSAPRPPFQVKPLLCFGVGLSPQCRLMHSDLLGQGGPPGIGVEHCPAPGLTSPSSPSQSSHHSDCIPPIPLQPA